MENRCFSNFTIKVNGGAYKLFLAPNMINLRKLVSMNYPIRSQKKIFWSKWFKKWAWAIHLMSYSSPLIRLLRKIRYNQDIEIKNKICHEIQEATHASTLKVILGDIVYNSTQDPNNTLQWYWNTKTKDYLRYSVTSSLS